MSKSFGQILKEFREKDQITQVTMAKLLGMARQTYLDLENGKTEPRFSTISNICKIFEIPSSVFFSDEDEGKTLSLHRATNEHLLNEIATRLNKK